MYYTRLKFKVVTGLFISSLFAVACNSGQSSSDQTTDSATARMNNTPDTVQTTVHDTVTVVQPAAPQQSSSTASTPAPATSTPAPTTSTPVPVTSTPAPVPPKNVGRRKGRVFVEASPVMKHPKIMPDKTGIYDYSEVSPQFRGGQFAIQKYIDNHIEYPEAALSDNREGRVGVSFIVNENGQVTNVHPNGRPLGDGLDQEAVKVVSSMPNWKPGTVKGRPVKTRVTLPIVFKIQG